MKKFTIALLSGVLAVLLFTLSGCADFAFNPIGRWTLTERRVYIGDRLDETMPNDTDKRHWYSRNPAPAILTEAILHTLISPTNTPIMR